MMMMMLMRIMRIMMMMIMMMIMMVMMMLIMMKIMKMMMIMKMIMMIMIMVVQGDGLSQLAEWPNVCALLWYPYQAEKCGEAKCLACSPAMMASAQVSLYSYFSVRVQVSSTGVYCTLDNVHWYKIWGKRCFEQRRASSRCEEKCLSNMILLQEYLTNN